MRNTIIRIIAFILTLISLCIFIIGSTYKGLDYEYNFSEYSTFRELIEEQSEEYKQGYIKNTTYYITSVDVQTEEEYVELLSSTHMYEADLIVTTKDGREIFNSLVYDKDDYFEVYTTEVNIGENQTVTLDVYYEEDAFRSSAVILDKGTYDLLQSAYHISYNADEIIIISSFIAFISFCVLTIYVGKTKNSKEISLSFIDKMPLEIMGAINIAFSSLVWGYGYFFYEISYELMILSLFFIVLIQLLTIVSIIARIKSKTLIKNSFTYKFIIWAVSPIRYFIGVVRYAFLEIPLVLKAVVVVLVLGFIILMSRYYSSVEFFLASFVAASLFIITYIYLANLKFSIKKISQGDFDYKTDTKYMVLDFKEMAENLNKINEGLEEATQKKIKSERLKTELITNVSHDIKTPLTSIINYVDLIKKQDSFNEETREYIEVLDRQSQKLKRLITDLVDASKINSGNIDAKLEEVSLTVVMEQIEGEYREKLENKNFNLIVSYPVKDVSIQVDGQHLNRVIDNLMINVLKYSLENTRVYIDAVINEDKAVIAIKNTSKQQLNIAAEDLMQRFVRGDESRHEEGNGLGLSIAQSLANVQGAKLDITVDGDLFKSEIIFNI